MGCLGSLERGEADGKDGRTTFTGYKRKQVVVRQKVAGTKEWRPYARKRFSFKSPFIHHDGICSGFKVDQAPKGREWQLRQRVDPKRILKTDTEASRLQIEGCTAQLLDARYTASLPVNITTCQKMGGG
uniref:Uncharacterized protein n=1 Tax=Peronospora matthiolae TaxID=2874970 RepID=A0AAV1T0K5_9STRA